MANLTQTSLAGAVKTQYEQRLLTRAVPRLVHGRYGMTARMNKYGAYELRRYGSLSTVTTPLTEGTTPGEQGAMGLTLITITPLFYGAWIGHTDELEMTIYDPLISEVSAILGEQCGVSMDTLIRNDLTANATKDYSGDQTARANLTAPQHNITYADFVKQVAELEAQSALPVDGEDFVVIVHPHTWASLNTDPIFVNMFIQESGQGNPMRSGYVGRILRCKVFVSGNARKYVDGGVSGADVYSMLFIGREAYGCAGIAGSFPNIVDSQPENGKPLSGSPVKPVEVIVKQLGSAGADDPLNQRATVGWKASLATAVLQANWLRDLEHTNIFSLD